MVFSWKKARAGARGSSPNGLSLIQSSSMGEFNTVNPVFYGMESGMRLSSFLGETKEAHAFACASFSPFGNRIYLHVKKPERPAWKISDE
jgi:hypothetical protein